MAPVYDNWERLVEATLRREELRIIGLRTPSDVSLASLSSSSSSFNLSSSFRGLSLFNFLSSLTVGNSFTCHEILQATDYFSHSNLIKNGHTGDLFYGVLGDGMQVLVERVDLSSLNRGSFLFSELNLFGSVSNSRLVPLVGHCFEDVKDKFLVYKYMPYKDLSSSLFNKNVQYDDDYQSLDWIKRMKIAIGAAEGLSYLHHYCDPPLVHRDIQASSILLDDTFEVRLGSLSEVCEAQEKDGNQPNRISWFQRLTKESGQGTTGTANATCSYDVYCLGKVLLELVTGHLGFSAAKDSTSMKDWMANTLPNISIHDKELVVKIVDPTLIIDEDLLMEVWAVAIIAKSCLNPKPSKRPPMMYILKALENPLKVVYKDDVV